MPSAMVTAAWVGSITGMPSACSSGPAVARHAGAAHHDGVSAPSSSLSARPTSIMRREASPLPLAVSATAHVRAGARLVEALD